MLFNVDTAAKTATAVGPATFAGLDLKERFDLQEWVLNNPALLGEELLVISTEFDRFDRTSERLDVLAMDRAGKLVVVELKRTAVGTAAELQALRYAAFCSTFSLEDVAELLARYVRDREGALLTTEDARDRILSFVVNPSFQALDDKPRIILAAQEFPPEITATVLWLRSFGVEVSCVRLTPYRVADHLLVDSSVLIPLPEAQEFLIRRARKDVEQAGSPVPAPTTADEFLARAAPAVQPLARGLRDWLVARPGISERVYKTLLSYRSEDGAAWLTWIELTKTELRVGLPPGMDTGVLAVIRATSTGWNLVSVRNESELGYVIRALDVAPLQDAPPGSYVSVEWGDFYVSFGEGEHRTWEDARRYGFISAGQGTWYSNSLKQLAPGNRVFAYIPKTGYVGVGIVREPAVPVREFLADVDGERLPILEAPLSAPHMAENSGDRDRSEWLVRVDWIQTLSQDEAIWEKGMFANQNSACRLTHPLTREVLITRFGLSD
jgi:hypothetical protein